MKCEMLRSVGVKLKQDTVVSVARTGFLTHTALSAVLDKTFAICSIFLPLR